MDRSCVDGKRIEIGGAGTAPLVPGLYHRVIIFDIGLLSHFECRKNYVYLWSSQSRVCERYIFLMKPELELVSEMYLSTHFISC
jgi:hypothetical protein